MKIITTLISIIGFQYMVSAQTAHVSRQPLKAGVSQTKIGYILSSEGSEVVKGKFTPSDQTKNIVITRLPAVTLALTSVNIDLNMLGSFTFQGAPSLMIPNNCEVFIEDKLTGKMFNLKTPEAYTFNVVQHIENRFIMHILDKTSPGTLVSGGIIRGNKTQS